MNKKKNLLRLFTNDISYNYHLIRTEGPDGHLIYLIKSESELNNDSLEFSPTKLAEELIGECSVQIDKIAPAIFFTDEFDTNKLKEKLDNKLSETSEFSSFIESIKDTFRILEVNDALLYKKDPAAYEENKRIEKEKHQQELIEDFLNQLKENTIKRETAILEYNNDLIKLLKEYFESIIEFEKRDFDFDPEIGKLLNNLIDPDTWLKVEEKPFVCKLKVCSLDQDRMNVFLTDNKDSYTATLIFNKTSLSMENVIKVDKEPKIMTDYDFLSKLYNVDIKSVDGWEFKNDEDRFNYVIDYLVPILKIEKDKKEKELVEKILAEEKEDLNENENNG